MESTLIKFDNQEFKIIYLRDKPTNYKYNLHDGHLSYTRKKKDLKHKGFMCRPAREEEV